jgi:hypothetical protein
MGICGCMGGDWESERGNTHTQKETNKGCMKENSIANLRAFIASSCDFPMIFTPFTTTI